MHNQIDFFFRLECENIISSYENILIWLFNNEPIEVEGSFCGILLIDSKENIFKLVNLGFSESNEPIVFYNDIEHFINDLLTKINKKIRSIL